MQKNPIKEITQPKQEVLIILPQADPETRGQFIQQRGKQIREGELTIQDVGIELKLSDKMIEFCRLYTSRDCLGHGKDCAAEAYGYDMTTSKGKQMASVMASSLLKHPDCRVLLNCLIDESCFNVENLKKQILEVCEQREDRKAQILGLKLGAEILGLTKKAIEVTVNHNYDMTRLSKEETKDLIKKLEKIELKNNPDSEDAR